MFGSIYAQVWAVALLSTCGFALWKGDKPEQAGSMVCLISWLATTVALTTVTPKYVWLLIDLGVLAAFGVIAWRSSRSWPMFATAFQAIGVGVHFASMLDVEIGEFAYISALAISSYGVLATLAVGTWQGWREREALNFANRG